jgi:hypothetical protein
MRALGSGSRVGGVAALALMLGCAADRPVPAAGDTPAAGALTAALRPAPGLPAPAPAIAAAPRPQVRTRLPPAVAMPGGGTRIDMRASGKHVRALERQPDGTFKHVCVDAPEIGQRAR